MLRGTDSWTPFVAPNATAGAPLVTGSAAILATCLVAAAGLAGLASPAMPARGRLVTMLLVGVVLLAAGYSGGLGSPVAARRCRPSWTPAAPRCATCTSWSSVIRIPMVLGLAQLLGRIPLPGGAPMSVWLRAFAHPERDKRVAVGDRGADGADGQHVAGVDGPARPAGHVHRDTRSTGTTPPTGSPSTTPVGRRRPGGCWWFPARRSPPRCGAPATTNRCRCSATARGVCATPSR